MHSKNWIKSSTIAVLIFVVIGCSSSKNTDTNTNTVSKSPADSAATSTQTASQPPESKKLTISMINGSWASPLPSPTGEGVNMINEKFNINLKPQFIPYDELTNKLPVIMAAGDLPDMIGMESVDANFVKWAKQGAFLPLNDYIDKYPTLKAVPKSVWDAVTVDGKIYAIPQYFPVKYGKKPIIRKDWLDNLGLPMPTNYEELKKAAIAFTNDDPDKNGKKDTYGLGMGKLIVYGGWMGAGYDNVWYYKNDKGQYIPGNISEGFKKQITVLRDLYKAGAINKDWAVTKVGDMRKDFFAGKFGIWYEQPYDISETRFKDLKKINPTAELAVIPAFAQEDGEQGYPGLSGYYQLMSLNANLKDDPDKIDRILQMEDYFRTFIPPADRNPQNADFDWMNGFVDKAYTMVNGIAVDKENVTDLQPKSYIIDRGWAPDDESNEPAAVIQDPFTKSFIQGAVDLLKTSKFYLNPIDRIHSEVLDAKVSELDKAVNDHQTRMIVGQESLDKWDDMVQEYLRKGGQDIIDDVNRKMQEAGVTGEWK
ncbi:extracellular solute-binding protein [Cohnella pontilimi]|nr:extracellular solute-binding protein [Cohnella pontilimi]